MISGARASYYMRETSPPSSSVGAHFRPGGAAALLGVPGEELAGRHAALADLWGRSAVVSTNFARNVRKTPYVTRSAEEHTIGCSIVSSSEFAGSPDGRG